MIKKLIPASIAFWNENERGEQSATLDYKSGASGGCMRMGKEKYGHETSIKEGMKE